MPQKHVPDGVHPYVGPSVGFVKDNPYSISNALSVRDRAVDSFGRVCTLNKDTPWFYKSSLISGSLLAILL
jgi:hypothetical protein